jgi:hypothetical protein
MTFKPGDRVRPRGWPDHRDMAVKGVRDGYALCELWPGSGIDVGAWLAEALEPVEHGRVVRLPAERRERD